MNHLGHEQAYEAVRECLSMGCQVKGAKKVVVGRDEAYICLFSSCRTQNILFIKLLKRMCYISSNLIFGKQEFLFLANLAPKTHVPKITRPAHPHSIRKPMLTILTYERTCSIYL